VGKTPSLYRSKATPPEVFREMWGELAAGRSWRGELLNRRKTGDDFWIRLTVTPIRGEGGQITHFVGINEDISESKRTMERQRLLLHELNHRVKNTLATVLAISLQTFRTAETPQAFVEAFEARLLSLSRTHNLLTAGNWHGALLGDVLHQEVAPYAEGEEGRFEQIGPDIHLGPVAAVTLGLAFHELATNAAKYGAFSNRAGHVRVGWRIEGERWLYLDWQEADGPPVKPPRRQGFGSALIQRSLRHELAGTVGLDFAPQGVRCTMEMLLDRVSVH
jgi:two-component sensor histidine kinase